MRRFVRNSRVAVIAFMSAIIMIFFVLFLLLYPKEIPIAFYIDISSGMNPASAYRQSLAIAMDYFNDKAEGGKRYRFVPVFLSSFERDEVLQKAVAANASALILAANPSVTQAFLQEASSWDIPIINISHRALRVKDPRLFHVRAPDTEKSLGEWAREFGLGDYVEITLLRDPLYPDDLESWFAEGMKRGPRRRLVYMDKNSMSPILSRLSKEKGLDGVYVNLPPYDGAVMVQLIFRAFPDLKIFASGSIINSRTSQLIGRASQFTNTITPLNLIEDQGYDIKSEHPFISFINRNGYARVMNVSSILVGYNAISLLHEAFQGKTANQTLQQALASQKELFSLSTTLHKNEEGDWVGDYYKVRYGTD